MQHDFMAMETKAPPGMSSYLMDDSDCEGGDWLAALDFGAEQLVGDVRRTSSAPGMHFSATALGHATAGTAPLPIRPTRRMDPTDYSSFESSQSFLASGSSFTEDSGWMQQQQQQQQRGGMPTHHGSMPHHHHHHHHHHGSMPQLQSYAPQCSCGAYAYAGYQQQLPLQPSPLLQPQDALAAVELAARFASGPGLDLSSSAPAHNSHGWVPVRQRHAHPSAVPVGHGSLPLPSPLNMDYALLDDVGLLEIADSLPQVAEEGGPFQRSAGSCPLPTLLEDSLNGGATTDGSDDTIRRSMTGASDEDMARVQSGVLSPLSWSPSIKKSTYSPRHAAPIAIPRRSAGLSRSGSLKSTNRLGRSHSHSNMAAAAAAAAPALGSSYPCSDRPVRTAARRSLAATAAALRDTADADFDADSEVDSGSEDGVAYYGPAPARPRGGSASAGPAGGSLGKKKHNPWSQEETRALVDGVSAMGVGKWAEIKRLERGNIADILSSRTAVDLKDKWRNLGRVARLPKATLKQRMQRGPSEVPVEVMLTVKSLLEAGGQES